MYRVFKRFFSAVWRPWRLSSTTMQHRATREAPASCVLRTVDVRTQNTGLRGGRAASTASQQPAHTHNSKGQSACGHSTRQDQKHRSVRACLAAASLDAHERVPCRRSVWRHGGRGTERARVHTARLYTYRKACDGQGGGRRHKTGGSPTVTGAHCDRSPL